MKAPLLHLVLAALAVLPASLPASAATQPGVHARTKEPARALPNPRGFHLDERYHHDHYYPAPGVVLNALPAGSVSIGWRGGSWFFHGGVWFRPSGPRFVVATPPPGIVAPFLPPASVPLWIGNVPYYYANGIYYAPAAEGFVVAGQPAGADAAEPMPPPTAIIYPRLGQDAARTDADRAGCNDWAAAQGANRDPFTFQRAFEACMEGRGYTVR